MLKSFVLPIVTKLNGIPEVTSDGDIIYIFPDLQLVSATSNTDSTYSTNKSIKKKEKDEEIFVLKQLGIDPNISTSQLKRIMIEGLGISTTIGALERNDLIQTLSQYYNINLTTKQKQQSNNNEYLQEQEYKFSLAEPYQNILSGGLGIINLFGALTLGNYLSTYTSLYGNMRLPSYYGIVQSTYPFLLSYAILFNAIPLIRYFWIKRENSIIQKRNKKRRLWNTYIKTSSKTLSRKLKSALSMGKKIKRLGSNNDDIVFILVKILKRIKL